MGGVGPVDADGGVSCPHACSGKGNASEETRRRDVREVTQTWGLGGEYELMSQKVGEQEEKQRQVDTID